jgi:hypothetical protein
MSDAGKWSSLESHGVGPLVPLHRDENFVSTATLVDGTVMIISTDLWLAH